MLNNLDEHHSQYKDFYISVFPSHWYYVGCALHKNAQTVHIWLTTPIWWRGITWSQIWKFLILLIACSMCILRLAISWVLTTSSAGIWFDPPRIGGRFRETPKGSKSVMVNPLPAITESLSWKGKSNRLLLLTALANWIPSFLGIPRIS